ncbi:hypothetical protein ETAA8_61750 [Anatilimnocola aggregata]|uniref:Carboxypeptidase regulatory-like domain-containing protein n=1 Tax=Anatilimnocola aggregata TaxID=2528021 RepID=A0A517YLB7_9BACT|nr:hypothetical protein [Anatilimnocola aggregata]QDU31022.1 hypothetical protein ETAA8_61750 [Anatilimnocola aggregata]
MYSRLAICVVLTWTTTIFSGCGNGVAQPEFATLHPVSGKLVRAGAPVAGGSLRFVPLSDQPEFNFNSIVEEDGSFRLTTVRTTDTRGERRPGAPAGEYSVIYYPVVVDQTVSNSEPVTLPQTVTIEANDNQIKLELPVDKPT